MKFYAGGEDLGEGGIMHWRIPPTRYNVFPEREPRHLAGSRVGSSLR